MDDEKLGKAIIAAALLQIEVLSGLPAIVGGSAAPRWRDHDSLRKLHRLTNAIYQAATEPTIKPEE